ncbi:MAG TPA: VWA domain-containing protein [Phycisphaerae bacterium]|nr:VWA domain-containing protein [Phycisphaerae bacterium]
MYRARCSHRRSGTVVVQVVVCSAVILGMGALVLDIGSLRTAQTELQVAADAAALAAAMELVGNYQRGDPQAAAVAAANLYASQNAVGGQPPAVLSQDVEFGRAILDPATGKFQFEPGSSNYDAVRVTVRRVGGEDGAAPVHVPFLFAPIFGQSGTELEARAAAVLIPRDIAVVIDLSGSMDDDSELRHYKDYYGDQGDPRPAMQINLRDIWCALDGPAPSRPYVPGAEDETEYADDLGPTIGAMDTWGSPVVPQTYDPASDPGLWYSRSGYNFTNAAGLASLAARGYSADEISCLASAAQDGSYTNQWRNRTAVILGLATWKSGRVGGTPGGDGDSRVEDNVTGEFTWRAYPEYRVSWTWSGYISYVTGSNAMTGINSALRYRFGLKTFTNYLLESASQYNQTNILWQTPEQPLRAVKDAVQAMTDVIVGLDSLDHMSLEVFAQTTRHEVDLTDQLQAVPERLYHMQSAHYNSYTNIGGGILAGITELQSARARSSSAKVIVLMSDGKPNVNENGVYEGFTENVFSYVREMAQLAADQGIRIYTISVSGDADIDLMAEIAMMTGGQHFHAEGTPEEYADQLDMIFRSLGGKRTVALIE